ncbi:MAG: cyanophycin synthetase [Patescibacteria group bacterium]|nr:cyanophycin synthetase [Patescibacteria group bacterium]
MNKEFLAMGGILKKIAPRIGAEVYLEPQWHVAGQITFKNGKHSYFRYNTLDLNSVGAADIAKDKDYAYHFMQKLGYPIIPESKTFFKSRLAEVLKKPKQSLDGAYAHAKKLGWPLIIKPNSGSQGEGVALVYNKKELEQGLKEIFKKDKIALVQKYIKSNDYRLVVLDNQVISAYQRLPLSVVGDGKATITKLLKAKQKEFSQQRRDTTIKIDDQRISNRLKRQNLNLESILAKGQKIYLLDNTNLSTGGDAIDFSNSIHPSYKKMAIKLTKDMGLRFCGVDILTDDITKAINKYWIIEINAAPGLDHYFRAGQKQAKIVENLYLQVLKSLEKRNN